MEETKDRFSERMEETKDKFTEKLQETKDKVSFRKKKEQVYTLTKGHEVTLSSHNVMKIHVI